MKQIIKEFTTDDITIFVLSLCVFIIYPFGNFYNIIGDNICQVAYGNILLENRNLVGSLGASAPKAGLIILLTFFFKLSNWLFGNAILIKLLLSIFAATLVSIISRIASDLGGRPAGLLAALIAFSDQYILNMFQYGNSYVFFLPLILIGIWLYAKGHHGGGIFVLCFGLLFRIDAVGIFMLLIPYDYYKNRDVGKSICYSAVIVAFIFVYFFFAYLVQGDLGRLNTGLSVGYSYQNLSYTAIYFFKLVGYVFYAHAFDSLTFLLLPTLFTFIVIKQSRIYLITLGCVILIGLNCIIFKGAFVARYFQMLVPITIAIGTGGLANTFRERLNGKPAVNKHTKAFIGVGVIWICMIILFIIKSFPHLPSEKNMLFMVYSGLMPIVLFMANYLSSPFLKKIISTYAYYMLWGVLLSFCIKEFNYRSKIPFNSIIRPYVQESFYFFDYPVIPKNKKVIIEDDYLYVILTKDPTYFKEAFALQAFNVKNDIERKRILESFDYIYMSKTFTHRFYYLAYVPIEKWENDPFRKAVIKIIDSNQSVSIYGVKMVPIENSNYRLVLKLVKDSQ